MSSNKRRKLEQADAAKPAQSAVSAIAARRKLGVDVGSASDDSEGAPSLIDSSPRTGNSNSFSALRNLSRQGNSHSSAALQTPRKTQSPAKTSRVVGQRGIDESRAAEDVKGASDEGLSSRAIQFSSFRPSKSNYRTTSDGVVQLRLLESERFLVLGSFGIKVIEGEVTVAGATLKQSSGTQWIHAPLCHAIPVLRTAERTRLEIHGDPNAPALRRLGKLSPLFRRIWNDPSEDSKSTSSSSSPFRILYSSDDAPKRSVIQDLVSPPAWNRKLASLVSLASRMPLSTLVCGPKSAGKSTFSRLLTNRLITSAPASETEPGVAVLDLDPGQPEFAPPGILSLVHMKAPNLSAPFTHAGFETVTHAIVRCHAIASATPASDPELYRQCAVDLFEYYKQNLGGLSLVVNTPGWILGTGLELLDGIISHVSPSEVVYMSEDGPAETVEVLQNATKGALTTLPSQQSEFTTRTAAHLRAMQTMCYFHAKSPSPKAVLTTSKWNPAPLSAFIPWQVGYAGSQNGILAVLSYDYQSPPDLLAETINGMVLAAVEIEDSKALRGLTAAKSSKPAISRTPEGLPFIRNPNDIALDPKHSRAIGLVLIRGIDSSAQALHLITPIPYQRIEEIKRQKRDIVLVHGKFDAPSWAYTEELYQRSGFEDSGDKRLEIVEEDTSEDDSDDALDAGTGAGKAGTGTIPWVEVLKGNDKRPVGSKVWRVRRDLGRGTGEG